jgi:tRNA threonylcarbamoyladenosine modification (KEOPS) complex  Pcc1 subunit
MIASDRPWNATITVSLRRSGEADWLISALSPEAAREVPRASATVGPVGTNAVAISIAARDAGAMRAALNTYLGWVALSLATAGAARSDGA